MRLKLGIKGENNKIPFNYHHLLTGCLHKWIGENNLVHGKTSLYSFSWLQNIEVFKLLINLKLQIWKSSN